MDSDRFVPPVKTGRSSFALHPHLSLPTESEELIKHVQSMSRLLEKLMPEMEFFEDANDLLRWINDHLPLIQWNEVISPPDCLNVYLLCRSSKAVSTEARLHKILANMINGVKNIRFLSLRHLDFYLQGLKSEILFVAEAQFLIENREQCQYIKKVLPSLAKKVKLGISSTTNIVGASPFPHELKTSMIQEKVVRKIQKSPRLFEEDLFDEMNRFLALSNTEFRLHRSADHLCQIICSQYLVKKELAKALRGNAEKRHLFVRFLRSHLHFTFGKKSALGLMISLNLQDPQEFFGEKHILQAMQKLIPSAQSVSGSLYVFQKQEEMSQVIYLEIEKKDGGVFSFEELQLLKSKLVGELKGGVEKLVSSIFMVKNEEEIMKNIVVLSRELRSPTDLPQITIHFEEQTSTELIFSVVLVRPIQAGHPNQFHLSPHSNCFTTERCQEVGTLGKHHLKEAAVLRFHIFKEPGFFRSDFSVNLYLARQKVMEITQELVGKVRDYTGGLLSEQEKQYEAFQQFFPEVARDQAKLLEDFFYSLKPIEAQCILPLSSLQQLFSEFLKAVQVTLPDKNSYHLSVQESKSQVAVVLKADPSLKPIIQKCLEANQFPLGSLTSSFVVYQELLVSSFIYATHNPAQQKILTVAIQKALQTWQTQLQSKKMLRLSTHDLRPHLDPRLSGGDREFAVILKMLYDGLTRIDKNGIPRLSSAQSVEISEDKKQYLFTLRDCSWSDGSKLVAYDFEYTWKRILQPNFKSPFSSLLFVIKNAKAAKEGRLPIDSLGVKSLNERELLVELELPAPYFLELLANPFCSPVNHKTDQLHPNWTSQFGESYVCNGPFMLKKQSSKQHELEKNHTYWDASSVELDQIVIYKTDPYDAFTMFKAGQIDWLGRPLRPWEPFFSKTFPKRCHSAASMVHWCVFNVQVFPLNNTKVREALAAALCRKDIIKALSPDLLPAKSPLPLEHAQLKKNYKESRAKARVLFGEALKEMGIKKENCPVLTIICLKGAVRESTAMMLKKQWEEALGVYCRVESYDWHTLFDKMTQGDYHIGGMTWKSLFNDPIYTLNAFKYQGDLINFSKWDSREYQSLLDAIDREENTHMRNIYYARAESILVRELPLIPLYYEFEHFVKNENLVIDLNTPHIDFKWLSIKNIPKKGGSYASNS